MTLTREQWVEEALVELVSAGFNQTGGLRDFAEELARTRYDAGTSPKAAVEDELSQLE